MTTKLWSVLARRGQVLVLLALVITASCFQHGFLSRFNLSAIAFQYSLIGFIALGQFLVMLTAGIDLSQGAIIGATSMVAAFVIPSLGVEGGVGVALLAGAAVGACNGLLAAFTKVPPFVATLGMMGIVRGIALTVTNSRPIPVHSVAYLQLARARIWNTPAVFPLLLVSAFCLWAFLSKWPLGRYMFGVGAHEANARLSGLPVTRVKLTAYTLSGLLSGLVGALIASRLGTGHPLSGTNYELESIAAAVIGGASLFGGIGRVSGIIAGVFILGVINSMINLSGASPYLHGTLKGGVILAAVALTQLRPSAWLRRRAVSQRIA